FLEEIGPGANLVVVRLVGDDRGGLDRGVPAEDGGELAAPPLVVGDDLDIAGHLPFTDPRAEAGSGEGGVGRCGRSRWFKRCSEDRGLLAPSGLRPVEDLVASGTFRNQARPARTVQLTADG